MEKQSFRGIWWPEGEPNNQIAGKLEYIPTSLSRLNLVGDFSDSMGGQANTESFEKILGVTDEGEPITLLQCNRDSRSVNHSQHASFISSEYVCQFIITGYHFKYKNPAFDKLRVSFYGMDWWARKSSPIPEVDISDPAKVTSGDKFGISMTIPEEEFAWIDQTKVSINARANTSLSRYKSGEVTVEHEFLIEPKRTQVPSEEYVNHITKLRDFVSLGLGAPALPRSIRGSVRKPDAEKVDIGILMNIRASPQTDFGHPLRVLFDLQSIRIDDSLPLWYEKAEKYSDTFNLYFGALYNDEMYPQNKFIGFCHALEAYHREKYGGEYVKTKIFDRFYNDMVSLLKGDPSNAYSSLSNSQTLQQKYSLPSNFVSSLEDGTLAYANEYSLRKRIKDITNDRQNAIDGLPYSVLGKEKLTSDTRNYFSHYTDELRKKAAQGQDLQELLWGVQQLLEACLLSEIGMSDSDINERLERRYENKLVN